MDIQLMLNYMSIDDAKEFITKIYVNNLYADCDKESMALSYAKLILEDYKKDEIRHLEYSKATLSSDEYYNKLEQKIADKEQQITELTKLLEVLKHEGVVSITTWANNEAHVTNTWNDNG